MAPEYDATIKVARPSGSAVLQSSGGLIGAQSLRDRRLPVLEDVLNRALEFRIRKRELEGEVVQRTTQDPASIIQRGRDPCEHIRYAVRCRPCRSERLDPGLFDRLRDTFANDGKPERLLGREVMMQRAAGHAGLAHDVVRAGRVIATGLEGARRDIQHAPPHGLRVIRSSSLVGRRFRHHPIRPMARRQSSMLTKPDNRSVLVDRTTGLFPERETATDPRPRWCGLVGIEEGTQ